jgi:hypothetical protein
VRAKVVEVAEVATYRRSSLRHYAEDHAPAWLDPSVLLTTYGLSPTKAGWRAYCTQLAVQMGDKQDRAALCSKQLSRGWCIGSKEFKKAMQDTLREQLAQWRERRFVGLEPKELKEERERSWDESLADLAWAAKIDLRALGSRKSAPDKVLLAAAMKRSTSVSNGWLAVRLGMGKPASVSQFVRRSLQTPVGVHATAALLSRVKV